MIYCKRTPRISFVIGMIFFSACAHTIPVQRPVQKIYITTATNVKVVLVGGAKPIHLSVRHERAVNGFRPIKGKKYLSPKQFLKVTHKQSLKAERKSKGYFVMRSNQPLPILLQIDSTQKTIYLQPKADYGRFLNMKYIFTPKDSLNTYAYKHWIYPRKNVLTVTDTGIGISRFKLVKQGTVNLTMATGLQIFSLKRTDGQYNNAGIFGIDMGVDYFYRGNRFLSFNAGAAVVPVLFLGNINAGTFYNYVEKGGVVYTSVRNNMVKGKFDAGYGLSFSRLYWTEIPVDTVNVTGRKERTTGLGLSFSAHYKVMPNCRAGILYQPNLVNINQSPAFGYQYLISVHFIWNFASGKSVLKSNYNW
jgi:hypothetical protein